MAEVGNCMKLKLKWEVVKEGWIREAAINGIFLITFGRKWILWTIWRKWYFEIDAVHVHGSGRSLFMTSKIHYKTEIGAKMTAESIVIAANGGKVE